MKRKWCLVVVCLGLVVAGTTGAVNHMREGRTGRPSAYTAEEDRILLSTVGLGLEETNKHLEEAGFEPRGANAIKKRRQYLRNRGVGADGIASKVREEQEIAAELEAMQARMEFLQAKRAGLVKEIREHYGSGGEESE